MKTTDPVTNIKGVGDKTSLLLKKLGITTVNDLIKYYPRGYEKYEAPIPISDLKDGIYAFQGQVTKRPVTKRVRNLTITSVYVTDLTGTVKLSFFNMPYLANSMKMETEYVFHGIIHESGKASVYCEHPKVFQPQEYMERVRHLNPVYSLTKGIHNATISKAVRKILSDQIEFCDILPEQTRNQYHLISLKDALNQIHLPDDENALVAARRRLVFEEFFLFLIAIYRLKEHKNPITNKYQMFETAESNRFIEMLPYRLTNAQKKVWSEIKAELTGTTTMNRMIQGDVGSGKTIVAILAMLLAATNGYQSAMMAPTEVLAAQHFATINEMILKYQLPLHPVLLTGALSAKEKNLAKKAIASNAVNVIFGTHALIQENVSYHNLALVITDEQHRFGVRQRESFAGKGKDTHVLVMSATPIPRSLAMILYGDMNLSVMNELPSNRLPIKTCVVNTDYRKKAYDFMKEEIIKGRQVYVICPMVEEGDMEHLENVMDYRDKLKAYFPETIRIEALHGKMRPAEKNKIMDYFSRGEIDILVSTTVIEVGINIPNATVMMVENAERFGLAQLHQLRGRVGRGTHQSYCIFVSGSTSKNNMERLSVLNKSNDGFQIAEEDLKLRGPGDLFGIRQSGMMDFSIADIYQDSKILEEASEEVKRILEEDPEFQLPKHHNLKMYVLEEAFQQVDFRTI